MNITTASTPTPELVNLTLADLKLELGGRVGTYRHNGVTYVVLRYPYCPLAEFVEQVKDAGNDKDLNPWVEVKAYDAGIRLFF